MHVYLTIEEHFHHSASGILPFAFFSSKESTNWKWYSTCVPIMLTCPQTSTPVIDASLLLSSLWRTFFFHSYFWMKYRHIKLPSPATVAGGFCIVVVSCAMEKDATKKVYLVTFSPHDDAPMCSLSVRPVKVWFSALLSPKMRLNETFGWRVHFEAFFGRFLTSNQSQKIWLWNNTYT